MGNAVAAPETPLDYLVRCFGVETEGGKVVESSSNMTWPIVLDQEPPVTTAHTFGMDANLTIEWKTAGERMDFLAHNAFTKTSPIFDDIPAIKKLLKDKGAAFERDVNLPRLGLIQVIAFLDDDPKKNSLHLIVGQFNRHFVRPERPK